MAPEDLILHKLIANRHKDLGAIEEIFEVRSGARGLDLEYLRRQAIHLGISERLEGVLPT